MSLVTPDDRLSGDYRYLWEIRYNTKRRICQSVYGTGEVETIGWDDIVASYHVIAPTEVLARATWQHRYGHAANNELLTCIILLRVDDEISIQGSRS